MAGEFNDVFTRSNLAAELPRQLADELIAGVTKQSAAMALGTRVQASTLDNRIPVISSLPQAYWESTADTALAQTTQMAIQNKSMLVNPISTIAVIPQDVLDDSEFAIWDSVKPKLMEAVAKKIDQAVLYGEYKPASGLTNPSALEVAVAASGGRYAPAAGVTSGSTVVTDTSASASDVGKQVFGPGINQGATVSSVSAGVSFTLSAAATATNASAPIMLMPAAGGAFGIGADVFGSTDAPSLVLKAALAVSQSGYEPTGAVTAPGWQWRAAAARTQQLVENPIGSDSPFNATLGGLGMRYSPLVGSRKVDSLVGRWEYLVVGVRKDITLRTLTEGVVSDDTGKVISNLAQQELVAVKVRARIGWYVATPPVADDVSWTGARSPFAFTYNNTGTAGPVGASLPETPEQPLTEPLPPAVHDGSREGTEDKGSRSASRKR